MPESSYIPFFTNLPNTPLGISDLIDLAIMRKVHKRDNFKHLDEKQFRENVKQNLYNYRKKLAKPKEERVGLTTEDPGYWAVPPSEWGKHGGKKFAKWNGPIWEKVGPKSFRDQLNEKMKEMGETFDPFEQSPEDTDGAQQDVGGAQSAQPIPVPLPFYARFVRNSFLKFTAGLFFGALLLACAQTGYYVWTHQEEGFSEALKTFFLRSDEHNAEAKLKRAYLEFGNNHLDAAENQVIEILQSEPKKKVIVAHSYYILGMIESMKNLPRRAIMSFDKSIEIYGHLGDYENLFLAKVERSKLTDDLVSFPEELASESHPRYWQNRYSLESSLLDKALVKGDLSGALTHAKSAYSLALKTNDVTIISWATNNLALCKAVNGESANKEFYQALEYVITLKDAELYKFNVACQFLIYKDPEAEKLIRQLCKDDPYLAKNLRYLGVYGDE